MDLGWFQKYIGKLIGVSTDTITYWENGRTEPSKKNMVKIKEFLKLKVKPKI
jgi:DNA-binding XRE family transcriptional regulator